MKRISRIRGISAAAFMATLSTAGRPAPEPNPEPKVKRLTVEQWDGQRFVARELTWDGERFVAEVGK